MPLFDHAGNDGLRDDKGCVQIHVDHLTELLRRHVAHRDALDNPGVVYEDVDHADLFLHLLDKRLYSGFVRYIADIAVGLNPGFLVGSKALVNELLTNIIENDRRARRGKRLGDGKTDPVGSARHKRNLPLQRKALHKIHFWFLLFLCPLPDSPGYLRSSVYVQRKAETSLCLARRHVLLCLCEAQNKKTCSDRRADLRSLAYVRPERKAKALCYFNSAVGISSMSSNA